MRVIPQNLNILISELINRFHLRIEFELRNLPRITTQLLFRLIQMIRIQMRVAQRVNEITDLKITDLRDHMREECIRCYVERNAEEDIAAALV